MEIVLVEKFLLNIFEKFPCKNIALQGKHTRQK